MTQKEQPVPDDTPSAGARLKQVRLAKGISFDDAHEKTKIHPNILKAIEEDNLVNVSPIYTKGFLKIYCSFLGVNPADYIPDYRKPQARSPYSPMVSQGRTSSGSAMKAFSMRVKDWVLRIKIKQVLLIAAVLIAAAVCFKLVKFIASRPKPQPSRVENPFQRPARRSAVAQRERAVTPARVAAPVVAVTAEEPSKVVEKKAPVASPIRLTIRAKEDCFVQLKTDGHTVYQGAVKKNRFESWQAKEKIEFSLSNAGAVELEVNGKTMTNIGRRKQALKNIVITKDGLSIL